MASVRISHSSAQCSTFLSGSWRSARRSVAASSLLLAALLAGCAEGGGASEQDFVPQDASFDTTVSPEAGKDVTAEAANDADVAAPDVSDAPDEKTDDVALDVPADGECAPGKKLCAGSCVDSTDPANGCGGSSCDPCKLANATAKCDADACAIDSCNAGYADCNDDPSDGCEADVKKDPANCGACGDTCVLPHATANCLNGTCGIESCETGFDNCDFDNDTGCEANLQYDPTHCGACENTCYPLQTTACVQGECKATACTGMTGDCDLTPGCETDLSSNMKHCGFCFNECVLPNATPVCLDATCRVQTCNTGWENCDGLHPNGCEIQTSKDASHCGACENAECSDVNNFSKSCKDGKCSYTCNAGFADCNGPQPGTSDDGCETPVSADPNNCGGCGVKCNNPHGTSTCEASLCVPHCDGGWGNCNNDASDGCEASLLTGTATCGSCNTACVNPNGTTSCQAGACVPVCNPGFADCDGNPVNGCETNTQTATSHCGQCGTQCLNPHGSTKCQSGVCLPSCDVGFASCDNDPIDGCETSTTIDPDNCGSCGHKCTNPNGSAACSNSVCTAGCDYGWGDCDPNIAGCETNTTNTTAHCGGCGKPCTNSHGSTSCLASVCNPKCDPGFASCDSDLSNGCETSTATDANNCGGCGSKCTNAHGSVGCANSVCTPGCIGTWKDCNGNPSDGCETDSGSSTSNCGACGTSCSNSNGTTSCLSGVCTPKCDPGFASCDNNPNNGCEAQITVDPLNCGACGTKCTNDHGGVACASSVCTPSCVGLFGNCDGNPNNGCETPLASDVNNCGGCNLKCNGTNGTPSCSSGTCAIGCNPGFKNCDNNLSNGCEKDVTSDVNNCGDCGVKCTALNGTNVCSGSVCVPGCNGGYASCDNNPNNGCEVDLNNDKFNCGGCGNACTPGLNQQAYCSGGACTYTCSAGYWDIDGNPANGCEYACTKTTDPTEICDSKDNDCDGTVDNGFDKLNDPNNCGNTCAKCGNATTVGLCCAGVCRNADVNNCGACGQACSPGMLVITELMINPSPTVSGEAQWEWIELYNPGTKDIDIRGFTLHESDNGESHQININLTAPVIVPAKSYRVIGGGDKASNGGVDVIYVYKLFTLANSNPDDVVITAFGTDIDQVSWTSSWATSGYSWELGRNQIDPVKNNNAANWCKAVSSYNSTDHGTPGLINDCPL